MKYIKSQYGDDKHLKVAMYNSPKGYEIFSYSKISKKGNAMKNWRKVEHYIAPVKSIAEKIYAQIVKRF